MLSLNTFIPFQVFISKFDVIAFFILCDASSHHVALEPIIRSHWPKDCHLDQIVQLVCINVLFWSVKNLLETGDEVCCSLAMYAS